MYGDFTTLWASRLIGLTSLLLVMALQRQRPHLPLRWWPLLLAQGLLDAGAYAALVAPGDSDDAAFAAVTASAFGAVTVLLAWVILRERIGALQWLGIAMIFVGVGYLSAAG